MKTNCNIKIPKKYQHMIMEIDYEGKEDGYWIYLYPEYLSENGHGGGTIHEYTQSDVLKAIKKCKNSI